MKWFFSIFFSLSFMFLAVFGVSCVYGYLFPVKHSEEISNACETFDVDKAIIYSVINVESSFKKDAISAKGAIGLMQIMPSTAQALAQEIDLKDYDMTEVDDNVLLGTYYISQLMQRFEVLETALCAYNAGPTTVANWLKNTEYSDDGKTLKEIPFKETNNYIKKFYKNYRYYKIKLK